MKDVDVNTGRDNLERMKTLDDAWNAQNWEVFRKRHSADTKVYWPGQPDPTTGRDAHQLERLFSPYPTTYFPNVTRQDAGVIDIGDRKTGFTIVVNPLPETTVSGVVVFDDDRPIVEANVTAVPVDHRGMIMGSTKTDSSGAFELRLLAGVSYLIRAGIRTERGFRQAETVVFVDQRKEGLRLSIRP